MFKNLPLFILFILASCASIQKGSSSFNVLEWDTPEGVVRLERTPFKVDFFPLVNVFESQSNKIYCGPTSGAIVLNALRLRDEAIPKPLNAQLTDKKLLKHIPKDVNPNFERYSQSNFLNAKTAAVKTQEEILGKPKNKDDKSGMGLSVRQLSEMLAAHGLQADLRVVNESLSRDKVKEELIANMKSANDFVLVNYNRQTVGQEGGGHISPLGAYDADSDSFLVLDVNSNKAKWVWITSNTLYDAMNTKDSVENRGYVLVKDKKS